MLFLSKLYAQYSDERYKNAFLAGFDYLLKAQYDNGGWPQFYPLKKGYYTHITYNDDSMVNILNVLKHCIDKTDYYSIKPSEATLSKAKIAFDKGIDCIIKSQYKQNGVLTAWCAQHDEVTLLPANARAYELASLSGKESAKIVLLLMSIKNPSPEIITAVNSAVAWFKKLKSRALEKTVFLSLTVKLWKKYWSKTLTPNLFGLVSWNLDNNAPFSVIVMESKSPLILKSVKERRTGYSWYTNEPKEVLKKYPAWKKKLNL